MSNQIMSIPSPLWCQKEKWSHVEHHQPAHYKVDFTRAALVQLADAKVLLPRGLFFGARAAVLARRHHKGAR